MTTDDARPIIRTLRDVLLEARGLVAAAAGQWPSGATRRQASAAGELLERLDGAIAEADKVLA